MHVCRFTCIVSIEARSHGWVSFLSCSPPYFFRHDLWSEPDAHWFIWTGWSVSSLDPPSCTCQLWRKKHAPTYNGIYMGTGDMDSSLHFDKSTLPTELFTSSAKIVFKFFLAFASVNSTLYQSDKTVWRMLHMLLCHWLYHYFVYLI